MLRPVLAIVLVVISGCSRQRTAPPAGVRDGLSLDWPQREFVFTPGGAGLAVSFVATRRLQLRISHSPKDPNGVRLTVRNARGEVLKPDLASSLVQVLARREPSRWTYGPGSCDFSCSLPGYRLRVGQYTVVARYANHKEHLFGRRRGAPDWIGEISSRPVVVRVVRRPALPWGKPANGLKVTITVLNSPVRLGRRRSLAVRLQVTLHNTTDSPLELEDSAFQYLGRAFLDDVDGDLYREAKRIDIADFSWRKQPLTLPARGKHTFLYVTERFGGRHLQPGKLLCYLKLLDAYSNRAPLEVTGRRTIRLW